jgi:predicted 2-oxoglutarate/Fe(II)-dependent dioxygenase YbiX|tara:strand:- start:612 stop:1175 length:564 start_codon:yes stop_codon:yes gene_type:complete
LEKEKLEMTNLLDIKSYIKCYENIIDTNLCKNIISHKGKKFNEAPIGDNHINKSFRNCLVKNLDDKFNDAVFKVVGNILSKYRDGVKYFSTGLSTEDTGYQHLLYLGSEKGEYKTHVDHFDLQPRILSCSIILNDDYEGGDFSFFEGQYVVKKQAGSAIVFPSNFCYPHAVTPVSKGDRHAIITWIH